MRLQHEIFYRHRQKYYVNGKEYIKTQCTSQLKDVRHNNVVATDCDGREFRLIDDVIDESTGYYSHSVVECMKCNERFPFYRHPKDREYVKGEDDRYVRDCIEKMKQRKEQSCKKIIYSWETDEDSGN